VDGWGTVIADWWGSLTAAWSWSDPVLVLGVLTVAVTALIPLALLQLGRRQAGHDRALNEQQTSSLQTQERLAQRQRRDSLSEIVDRSSDPTHIGLLWREVKDLRGQIASFFSRCFALAARSPCPDRGAEWRSMMSWTTRA
jgi:hypothetical protein